VLFLSLAGAAAPLHCTPKKGETKAGLVLYSTATGQLFVHFFRFYCSLLIRLMFIYTLDYIDHVLVTYS
jgi:hypothetical protein